MSDLPARPTTPATPRSWAPFLAILFGLSLLLTIPAVASAAPGDIGFEGPPGPGGAPSGSKPESKLWFNDGSWWGSLYDTGTGDTYIWKLNQATDTWSRTSTRIDDRSGTRADVLWDGTKLYVASHIFNESDGSGTSRLYRFSYNTSNDTYSLDSGFPATINSVRSETLVIAKDSTGQLWATWEANGSIWLNRTTTGDSAWGTPFQMPGAASVNTDDISSIIAFGGDKVGVMWSDQSASPDADFFAIHQDSAGDTTWSIETAYTGTNVADDHINLKTDSAGRVYAAVKTSLTGSNPLIVLLVRQANGTWSNHTVSTGTFDNTRPIVVIDEVNNLLRVYATSAGNGGTINEHVSALSPISFPGGDGTVVMLDASAPGDMNNVTTFKGNATAATGLVLLAFVDTPTRVYWHADILGGGPPGNTPPTANPTSATTTAGQAVTVNLSGSDPETCQLTFSIVTQPAHGTLGSIGGASCASGSPNTDTATVSYSPTAGYTGPDSFTYRVNDGTTDSAPATASVTVNPSGGGGPTQTFGASDDAQVRSSTATTNYGSLTTIRLGGEGTSTTYRTYVKFAVSGLTGTVTGVKLRLFATDASPNIVHVAQVTDTSWTEGAINWNNKPALGTERGSGPVPTLNAYNEITLNPASVAGNGTVSFGLTIDGTNSAIFSSSEGSSTPQLVVTQSGGPPPPNTPPTANPTSATTTAGQAVSVNLTGSDPETCQLAFSIVSPPSNGTLGSISNAACAAGSPNTDSATVGYTPTGAFTGSDSFTYRVNDGTDDSATATASITVDPAPPGDIDPPVRGATTVNGATLSIAYNEALDGTSEPAGPAFDVQVNGSARTVTGVDVAGSAVTLTLATPVVSTDGVTLSYAIPGTNPIQDLAGNDAPAITGATVTNNTPPTGGGGTVTSTPGHDAQVRSSTPTSNFGSMTTIRVGGEGTSVIYRSYLTFDVSGLSGSVTAVKLRLYATDASPNIVHVFQVTDTGWTESTINWDNKPALGTERGSSAVPTLNGYNEITLAPASVSGNGLVSFAITIDGTNSAIFSSAEGANAPQLVVTHN